MEASFASLRRRRRGPTFAELYTPKLVTILREGYSLGDFRADAIAGLTVAIVALPLSMAIAIASGVGPERGLFTAIIGGFLVSALGGSRFQIGGPAGAFIVLIAAVVERHGYDGLVLATLMGGLILTAAGLLRLGTYIKYIPFPVTVGFTAGIAVVIFCQSVERPVGARPGARACRVHSQARGPVGRAEHDQSTSTRGRRAGFADHCGLAEMATCMAGVSHCRVRGGGGCLRT